MYAPPVLTPEERAQRRSQEDEFRKAMEAEQAETFWNKFARTLGGPGYAVLNILRARPGAAAKNLLDTLTGVLTVDPITGLGSRLATREEQPMFTETLEDIGIDVPKHRGLRTTLDIGGGLLTDPLTWISAGGSSILRPAAAAKTAGWSLKRTPAAIGDLRTALSTTERGRGLLARYGEKIKDLIPDTASKLGRFKTPSELTEHLAGFNIVKKYGEDIGEGFAARHGLSTEALASMNTGAKRYVEALHQLQKQGYILPAGIYSDPWLIRAPLRMMGLIGEGAMERKLLTGAGGFFDKTIAGQFIGGAAGEMLGRLTLPGMAWRQLGKRAPKVQELLTSPWQAAIRAVWNPTFGKLGKRVPPGVAHRLEDLDEASRHHQWADQQNFRDAWTNVVKDLDEDSLEELSKRLDDIMDLDDMEDLVQGAADDVFTNIRRGSGPPPTAAGGRVAPEGPPAPTAPTAATVERAVGEAAAASDDAAKLHGVPVGQLDVQKFGVRIGNHVEEVDIYSAPVEWAQRTLLGEEFAAGTRRYRNELNENWFETAEEALGDWATKVREGVESGAEPAKIRQWTKNRATFVDDIRRAREAGAITDDAAKVVVQLTHLFDDSLFDMRAILQSGEVVTEAKRFGVMEMLPTGKVRVTGGLAELAGGRAIAEQLIREGGKGARAVYDPTAGMVGLFNQADNITAQALRAAPLGVDKVGKLRTMTRDYLHEMFHNGYFTMLTPAERAEISKLYEKYKKFMGKPGAPALYKDPVTKIKGAKQVIDEPAGALDRGRLAASDPQEFFAEFGARWGVEGLDAHLKAKVHPSEWSFLRRTLGKIWGKIRRVHSIFLGKGGVNTRMGINESYAQQMRRITGGKLGAPWEEGLGAQRMTLRIGDAAEEVTGVWTMGDVLTRIAPGLDDMRRGKALDVDFAIRPVPKRRPVGAPKLVRPARAPKKVPTTLPPGRMGPPILRAEMLREFDDATVQQLLRFEDEVGRLPSRAEIDVLMAQEDMGKALDDYLQLQRGTMAFEPGAGGIGDMPESAATFARDVKDKTTRVATVMSGTGTLEAGLGSALPGGVESVLAVEYAPKILDQFNLTHATKHIPQSVFDLDPSDVARAKPDIFSASPECKNWSKAKRGATPAPADLKQAMAVVDVINGARPPVVVVENVPRYANTNLVDKITDSLTKQGYTWDINIVNAAELGAAQTRPRMFVRAVLEGDLPPLPAKREPADWYATIEDLIAGAPVEEIGPSELRRIGNAVRKGKLNRETPIITMGGSASRGLPYAANAGGPSPTLLSTPASVPRILMPDGSVKRVTPRMMARLMGMPEGMVIPDKAPFAKLVLGNGIHGDVSRDVIAPLITRAKPRAATKGAVRRIESVFDELGEVDEAVGDAAYALARDANMGITRDRDLYAVVRDESGEVIGAQWRSFDGNNYEFDVVVSPKHRGTGIGTSLIDDGISGVDEYLDFNPNTTMRLSVTSGISESALSRRGFKVVGGDNRIKIMERPAPPRAATFAKDVDQADISPYLSMIGDPIHRETADSLWWYAISQGKEARRTFYDTLRKRITRPSSMLEDLPPGIPGSVQPQPVLHAFMEAASDIGIESDRFSMVRIMGSPKHPMRPEHYFPGGKPPTGIGPSTAEFVKKRLRYGQMTQPQALRVLEHPDFADLLKALSREERVALEKAARLGPEAAEGGPRASTFAKEVTEEGDWVSRVEREISEPMKKSAARRLEFLEAEFLRLQTRPGGVPMGHPVRIALGKAHERIAETRYMEPRVGEKLRLFRGVPSQPRAKEFAEYYSASPSIAEAYAAHPSRGMTGIIDEIVVTPKKILDATKQIPESVSRKAEELGSRIRSWDQVNPKHVEFDPYFFEAARGAGYDLVRFDDFTLGGVDNSFVWIGGAPKSIRRRVGTRAATFAKEAGEPAVKREGLFIPQDVLDRAKALYPGGASVQKIREMIQREVTKRMSADGGVFHQIADDLSTDLIAKHGLDASRKQPLMDTIKDVQTFVHAHHQEMLADVQRTRGKLEPTLERVMGEAGDVLGVKVGRIGMGLYLPRQISDEYAAAIALSRGLDQATSSQMHGAISTAYETFRTTKSVPEFRDAIRAAAKRAGIELEDLAEASEKVENLFDIVSRRFSAHNRAKWNHYFLTRAAEVIGRQHLPTAAALIPERQAIVAARQALSDAVERNLSEDVIRAARKEVERLEGWTPGTLKAINRIEDVDWSKAQGAEAFVREAMRSIAKSSKAGEHWDHINWWLKQSMTIGIGGVPNLAFSMRNLIGGIFQALMDPSTTGRDAIRPLWALMLDFPLTRWFAAPISRAMPGTTAWVREVSDFRKALDAPELRWLRPGEVFEDVYARLLSEGDDAAKALERLEQAYIKNGVTIGGMRPMDMVREIWDQGILGRDYAASELLRVQLGDVAVSNAVRKSLTGGADAVQSKGDLPSGIWTSIKNNSMPRKIAGSVEDTMRLNTYLSMRRKGISAQRATQRTNKAHVSYNYVSEADRALRRIFPFIRFQTATLATVPKAALTRPGTASPLIKGMQSLRAEEGELTPPWLHDKTALPVGLNEEGQMMFLTQFGLIHENVNTLLSGVGDVHSLLSGRDVTPGEWGSVAVLGALHPWLKGIMQYATGKDFFFGTEYGDYRRAPSWMTQVPGMESALSATGLLTKETSKSGKDYYKVPRWYHPVMGMTPLNRLSNEIHKVLDERKNWVERLILSQTGVKIVSVDQERELRRALGEWLKDQVRAGDIGKLEVFFAQGELPPEAAEMLKYYNDLLRGKKSDKAPVKPGPGVGAAPSSPVSGHRSSAPPAPQTGLGSSLLRPTSLSGR